MLACPQCILHACNYAFQSMSVFVYRRSLCNMHVLHKVTS